MCFKCYNNSKKSKVQQVDIDSIITVKNIYDIPELISIEHDKNDGQCCSCGQRMDKRVARVDITYEKAYKLLCPFCSMKVPNPATDKYVITELLKKETILKTGLTEEAVIELIREFPLKSALVATSKNLKYRKYWTWEQDNPILYMIVVGYYIRQINLRNVVDLYYPLSPGMYWVDIPRSNNMLKIGWIPGQNQKAIP